MIVTPLSDPFLRRAVRRAALPDEDVIWRAEEIREALARGFPRLLVYAPGDTHPLADPHTLDDLRLPTLALTGSTLRVWEQERRATGFAVSKVDDHAARLRSLIQETAGPLPWVEGVFRDLVRASGRGIPPVLRGLGRRILEFPSRYDDLHALAELTGISRAALKARFRRRDLPSPYTYLRWFRVLAAGHLLDQGKTTATVAHRVGLHSSGNLCRYVQDVSGMSPNELRGPQGRARSLAMFTSRCLGPRRLEAWETLEDLFLRDVG
ncbi:MAG: helix-turn-helix domain-containing protein [Gemmatimonadetes bacterium]|nr:AraC family transcriptional regulator [Gemmatimonadota bacterium]NIR80767.1 AraC family transcriptional regulator [Gemmatimonadota bacterium]NIT89584.1 AraC family transcriptional regulator [Gemmatimonadota bacterium]NIU33367.1 AraC family transcriptional regulator [Gemmatimonadota bacterium]NIU37656.1 helix-turn-helix domain-containing protein [Gemmatimonadota bacterium]